MYQFEGYAIVSADDKIADAEGTKPAVLGHPADWARFQAALDQAAIIVIGRRSHEATPNPEGRNRLVMSRQIERLERREDGTWWNPADVPLDDALAMAAPGGGLVAIPGGREVFDYFLGVGFDAFHLSRLPMVLLPGGIPVLSSYDEGLSAEAVLDGAGLEPGEIEILDASVGLSVTVWRR